MGIFKPNVEKMGKKKNVEGLIEVLKDVDEDNSVRKNAAKALGEIGDARAVEPLIQALKARSMYVNEEAVEALGNIKDIRAVMPIIKAMGEKLMYVKFTNKATEALVKIGKPATEPLIHVLKNVRPYVGMAMKHSSMQAKVIEVLGEIGDSRAVEPLTQTLRDKDWNLGKKAAEALNKLDWQPKNQIEESYRLLARQEWDRLIKVGEPAIEPLICALKDEDRNVIEKSSMALAQMGEPVIKPLLEALDDIDENKDIDFLKTTIVVIGDIGEPAVKPLIEALKDENRYVRLVAATILGDIKDERAIPSLIKTQEEKDKEVSDGATLALVKIGKPAIKPLIEALENEDIDDHRPAVYALGHIGKPAVTPLIETLKNKDMDIRIGAASALITIGKPAIESLNQALKDEDENVRYHARFALGKIKELNR
ncbi:MAG: HEAT repeat domain-containing protein [Methanomassiliicoccales archaeon]|nr:MAG: HEAT repeat domain-containing protein [Methanomassiliicoccales archaeon]